MAVAVGLGWWAGAATLRPPAVEEAAAAPPVYTVVEGTVGRTMPATAVVRWDLDLAAMQAAGGTVTTVEVDAGDEVSAGDVLFTVDERPAVVAEGRIPAYRDLARGAVGEDVAQLQRLLAAEGRYAGADDGRFGAGTARAVEAWQRSLGVDDDGVVRQGDVVFVTGLPLRVALSDELVVGRVVSPGSEAVWAVAETPRFVIPLAEGQRDLVPLSGQVRVEHPGGVWDGRIASADTGEDGGVELVLEAEGGGPVCGQECAAAVPVDDEVQFRARIVAVPETTGPLVPAAALRTDAGGQVWVTTAAGDRREVEVAEADAGQAVVTGVEVGESILLFGEAERSPAEEPAGPGGPDTDRDSELPDQSPGEGDDPGAGG